MPGGAFAEVMHRRFPEKEQCDGVDAALDKDQAQCARQAIAPQDDKRRANTPDRGPYEKARRQLGGRRRSRNRRQHAAVRDHQEQHQPVENDDRINRIGDGKRVAAGQDADAVENWKGEKNAGDALVVKLADVAERRKDRQSEQQLEKRDPGFSHHGQPAKNDNSASAVASGFSSVRKCPESMGPPRTSSAHWRQILSGPPVSFGIPAAPHNASSGPLMVLPAARSASSFVRSAPRPAR